jgi:hypothetical protein
MRRLGPYPRSIATALDAHEVTLDLVLILEFFLARVQDLAAAAVEDPPAGGRDVDSAARVGCMAPEDLSGGVIFTLGTGWRPEGRRGEPRRAAVADQVVGIVARDRVHAIDRWHRVQPT